MTNEQKLSYAKTQFVNYIENIHTLQEFRNFLNNVTKEKVIIALKNRIDTDIDNRQGNIDKLVELKGQLDLL